MSNIDIVRAWKDAEYRNTLTAEERASLPENPAGLVELDDNDLGNVDGGTVDVSAVLSCALGGCPTIFRGTCGVFTVGCC
ncbi:MAG: mersacidin/lichenicidin family type 2 lantibiotic [Chloroflexi bacterium]|nr:mersacidin/lichenicidin family type 2 lantibiotic [Chloroflexota bacterium]